MSSKRQRNRQRHHSRYLGATWTIEQVRKEFSTAKDLKPEDAEQIPEDYEMLYNGLGLELWIFYKGNLLTYTTSAKLQKLAKSKNIKEKLTPKMCFDLSTEGMN